MTKATITLNASQKVSAGTKILIEWTGPDNKGDYLTIVSKDTKDGKYAYTKKGSSLLVQAPAVPGDCEIRYKYLMIYSMAE